MRLSQLARKLGVTQSDIIGYVKTIDDSIILSVHSKIDESILEAVKEKYDPTGEKFAEKEEVLEEPDLVIQEDIQSEIHTPIDEVSSESITLENEVNQEEPDEIEEVLLTIKETQDAAEDQLLEEQIGFKEEFSEDITFESTEIIEDIVQEEVLIEEPILEKEKDLEEEDVVNPEGASIEVNPDLEISEGELNTERYAEDESEVIRAKLVKLEGIKVVGKIELPPPPKPKEKEVSENDDSSIKREKNSVKGKHHRKNYKKRKPESLKQKQEREEKRQERIRKAQELKLKEKKKLHYIEKLEKTQVPKPAAAVSKQKKNKKPTNRKPMVQKSKNPVRRFWHWLNGKYDSY